MEQSFAPPLLKVNRQISSSSSSSSSSNKTGKLLYSVKLPKKPSLQSLFTPSFLQPSSSATDSSPPLSFSTHSLVRSTLTHITTTTKESQQFPAIPAPSLLDDDPFANLTSSNIPVLAGFPNSFEYPTLSETPRTSTVVVSPRATVARPRSSGHGQTRPARTKPAFVSRPSLPSLHTLAQMNVTIPRKVRKGTPGARLPHEPWNMDVSAEFSLSTRGAPSSASRSQLQSRTAVPGTQSQGHTYIARIEDTTLYQRHTSNDFVSSCEARSTSPDHLIGHCHTVAAGKTSSPRSLSADDADIDSLPSLSYTTSGPSSSALSRSSSIASSPWRETWMDRNNHTNNYTQDTSSLVDPHHAGNDPTEDDDPLSYHSDFDYYTQSRSDLSDFEPDANPTTSQKTRQRSRSPDVGTTPSVHAPDADLGSQTSTDIMCSVLREHAQTDCCSISSSNQEPPLEGSEWRGRRGMPERQSSREEEHRGRERGESRCDGGQSGSHSLGGYGDGAGGDNNDGDKGRRSKSRSSVLSTSDYTSSSDDADGNTVYYSIDGMSNGPPSRAQSRTQSRHSEAAGGSDDDIPLAQRVPTALTAQKSIRKQLRDERQQRRLERAKSTRTTAPPPLPPLPMEPISTPVQRATHTSRHRSISAAPGPVLGSHRREQSRARHAPIDAFPAEDLTRKLMNLQASSHTPPPTAPPSYDASAFFSARAAGYSGGVSRSSSRGRYMDQAAYMQQMPSRAPEVSPQDRPLRSMRSFHRTEGRYAESRRIASEATPAQRLRRSVTAADSNHSARNVGDGASTGCEQLPKSGRVSEDGRRPPIHTFRPSLDRESDVAVRVVQRPLVPPLPTHEVMPGLPQQPVSRVPVVQQRIFIGDMQRFNMVEITPATNAGDVIDVLASQGVLDKSGSWMLFELAQDYGMERPIRDYELLIDVSASWNKDQLLNAFVIKSTPLARILSRSAVPTSSPTYRGWVEWESKRGKWSKRWMELREHGLWLSKRNTGKDEVFLCSLSNFDAYYVTRGHKSPKAFVFAVKSADHLSLFENAADYLHVFSCNQKDGERWMEAILVARSYVLYQERHVLFAKTGDLLSQAKPLARSQTRKQSVSGRLPQPLISVPPPFSQSPITNITFEPGSLLAKRKGDAQP
ncbi:hypothetical protein BS17DRAFT_785021 [Gyrodon lividus]|nr:hypothetical protein BS17DRAFT_785021 [Gyrodon lividus]